MVVTIGIPLGLIVGLAIVLAVLAGAWRAGRRRKKLQRLRERQEAARLTAIERAVRPPLWRRLHRKMTGEDR